MLLSQSAKVLNKNKNTEKNDDFKNGTIVSVLPLITEIVRLKMSSNLATHQSAVTGNNKSIIVLQNVALTNLSTPKEQLGKQSFSPDQEGYNSHP